MGSVEDLEEGLCGGGDLEEVLKVDCWAEEGYLSPKRDYESGFEEELLGVDLEDHHKDSGLLGYVLFVSLRTNYP